MDTFTILQYLIRQDGTVSVNKIADDTGISHDQTNLILEQYDQVFKPETKVVQYYSLYPSQYIDILKNVGIVTNGKKRKINHLLLFSLSGQK